MCLASDGTKQGECVTVDALKMLFCLDIVRFHNGECHILFLNVGIGTSETAYNGIVIFRDTLLLQLCYPFAHRELQMNRGARQGFAQDMDLQLGMIIQCHKKFAVFFQNSHLQSFRYINVVRVLYGKCQAVMGLTKITNPIIVHCLVWNTALHGAPLVPGSKQTLWFFRISARRYRLRFGFLLFQASRPPFQFSDTNCPSDMDGYGGI